MKKTVTRFYEKTTVHRHRTSVFSSLAKYYLSFATLLLIGLGLNSPSLQAQATYIKCATNLNPGQSGSPYDGEAQVQNGVTYMVWDMVETTNDLLGASPTSHSGGISDIYVAIVDENCMQTVGTYSGRVDWF